MKNPVRVIPCNVIVTMVNLNSMVGPLVTKRCVRVVACAIPEGPKGLPSRHVMPSAEERCDLFAE